MLEGTNLLINNDHQNALRYPISVKLNKGFFRYLYPSLTFEGRQVANKYPTLAQALAGALVMKAGKLLSSLRSYIA